MEKVIVICGPTASGKTSLAIELAKLLNGEIISADSMQIYRGMDIGTAKVTEEEADGIRHHMIDICDPGEEYSVARYGEEAYECVLDIVKRGKTPIVCGGTGLYIDALIRGNDFAGADISRDTRLKLSAEYDAMGGEHMHKRLSEIDPESAEKLHPNDRKRIVRALEVYEDYGITLSEHNRITKSKADRLDSVFICLNPVPREFLYERINRRVDIMAENGLLDETERLLKGGLLKGTAAQAIGYKEMLGYMNGEMSFEGACELLKRKSRNYAKRQLTWFKGKNGINWIEYEKDTAFETVLQKATKILCENGVEL